MCKITENKFFIFLAAFLLVSSCGSKSKTTQTIYTNCKLPVADGSSFAAIGFPRHSSRLASTGTVNSTVIMVDFPDAVATLTPAQAYAEISGAASTFSDQSYGRFNYSMTPELQWFRMSQNSTAYTLSTTVGQTSYITEALSLADASVNFANTDQLVVLANPDASGIGTTGPAFLRNTGGGITVDGKEILNAVTSAYDLNTWGSIWLNHETTHNLGLVDLYYGAGSTAAQILGFVGGFSYMGYNAFTYSPGLTAWERWLLGWLDDTQITCANPLQGDISTLLTPIGSNGGMKAVMVPISSTKVVVVESRRRSGLDVNLTKEGALVYVVDSSIATSQGPIRVYPQVANDTYFLQSPRAAGESVTVEGITVKVMSSTASGDTVRVTSSKNWVEF